MHRIRLINNLLGLAALELEILKEEYPMLDTTVLTQNVAALKASVATLQASGLQKPVDDSAQQAAIDAAAQSVADATGAINAVVSPAPANS